MAKLIFTLLLFGIGCILAWSPPEGPLRHRGCKKSCLQFASFLKKQDFDEPGFVFRADPALRAMTFCVKERLHCENVERFASLVYTFHKAGIPKRRFCQFSKICPKQAKFEKKKQKSFRLEKKIEKGKFDFCKECRTVIGTISYGVRVFNYTEGKIKSFIEALCKLSPLQVQAKVCKVVIDEIDRVFQMILNGVKPGKICVALGICKNGTSFTEDQFAILKTPIAGSLSNYFEKKTEIHKRMPAVLGKYPAINELKKNSVQANVTCTLCLTITTLISDSIKYANSTIEAIEEAIRLICDLQPQPSKAICLGFLSKIDEIIQYIEKGLSPGEICKTLGFCPKAKVDMNAVPIKPDIKTSPSCDVCDSIRKTFGKEMKDYKHHAEKMQRYLIDVCRNTKQPHIQEKCLSVVPMFAMADGMKNSVFDSSLCRKITCSEAFGLASSAVQSGNTTFCDICLYITKMFTSRIKYFEKVVLESLGEVDQICDLLVFKKVESVCHMYVNKTRVALKAIAKKTNAKFVCTALKVCPKKETTPETSVLEQMMDIFTTGNTPTCGICKVAVGSVFENEDTKMVRSTLEDTCDTIRIKPGKKVCKKLLRHLDSIIEAREEKKSPEEICDLLKLCEKNVPVMKIFQGVVEGLKDLFADW